MVIEAWDVDLCISPTQPTQNHLPGARPNHFDNGEVSRNIYRSYEQEGAEKMEDIYT